MASETIQLGTPLPWSLAYGFDTREFGGEAAPAVYVAPDNVEAVGIKLATPWVEGAWDDDDEARANAAYIVRAANCHPELLEALEGVAESLEHELNGGRDILRLFEEELEPDQEVIDWLGVEEGRKVIAAVIRLRQARAVLAKAKSGAVR